MCNNTFGWNNWSGENAYFNIIFQSACPCVFLPIVLIAVENQINNIV